MRGDDSPGTAGAGLEFPVAFITSTWASVASAALTLYTFLYQVKLAVPAATLQLPMKLPVGVAPWGLQVAGSLGSEASNGGELSFRIWSATVPWIGMQQGARPLLLNGVIVAEFSDGNVDRLAHEYTNPASADGWTRMSNVLFV